MDRVTTRLVDLLDLDIRKQRLDSTHVFSNMATFGRMHMMAVSIKRFLTQLKRHERDAYDALPAELRQRYAPSSAQLLAKESKDPGSRAKTRQQVAEDLHDLINRFGDHPGMRERTSYQALVKIFGQQCELVGGRVKVRAKTGANCMQNPSDPEATYHGKKGPGYQVQISETCSPDNDVQLITTVLPQTAAEPDSYALLPMLQDLQKKDCLPEEITVDTAYGSDENVQAAAAMDVEVISPVAGVKETAWVKDAAAPLNTDDFAIDERNGKVEKWRPARQAMRRRRRITMPTRKQPPSTCRPRPARIARSAVHVRSMNRNQEYSPLSTRTKNADWMRVGTSSKHECSRSVTHRAPASSPPTAV